MPSRNPFSVLWRSMMEGMTCFGRAAEGSFPAQAPPFQKARVVLADKSHPARNFAAVAHVPVIQRAPIGGGELRRRRVQTSLERRRVRPHVSGNGIGSGLSWKSRRNVH